MRSKAKVCKSGHKQERWSAQAQSSNTATPKPAKTTTTLNTLSPASPILTPISQKETNRPPEKKHRKQKHQILKTKAVYKLNTVIKRSISNQNPQNKNPEH